MGNKLKYDFGGIIVLNNVTIMGRLTTDADVRITSNGNKVCSFSIAVQRPHRKDSDPEADFFSCVAWKGTAELIEKYFHKGNMIAIQGKLRNESYLKNNEKRFITRIIVEKISFTGEYRKEEQKSLEQHSSLPEPVISEISDEEIELMLSDEGVPF